MVHEVSRKGPWSPRARKLNSHTITVVYRRPFFLRHESEEIGLPGLFRRESKEELVYQASSEGKMKKNWFTRALQKGK